MRTPPKAATGSGPRKKKTRGDDGPENQKAYDQAYRRAVRDSKRYGGVKDQPDKPVPLSNARELEQQTPAKKKGPMKTPAWPTRSKKGTSRWT